MDPITLALTLALGTIVAIGIWAEPIVRIAS
jgi:hypothetical protein